MIHSFFHLKLVKYFFIQESKDMDWAIIVRMKPRDLYNIRKELKVEDDEIYTQCMPYNLALTDDLNATSVVKMDIKGEKY